MRNLLYIESGVVLFRFCLLKIKRNNPFNTDFFKSVSSCERGTWEFRLVSSSPEAEAEAEAEAEPASELSSEPASDSLSDSSWLVFSQPKYKRSKSVVV